MTDKSIQDSATLFEGQVVMVRFAPQVGNWPTGRNGPIVAADVEACGQARPMRIVQVGANSVRLATRIDAWGIDVEGWYPYSLISEICPCSQFGLMRFGMRGTVPSPVVQELVEVKPTEDVLVALRSLSRASNSCPGVQAALVDIR